MIQECRNADVIKICRKNPLEYAVGETKEELITAEDTAEDENADNYDDMKVDELRALAKEKEIEGYSKMKKEELIAALEASEVAEEVI